MVEKQHVDYLKLEKTIFKKDNKIKNLQSQIDDHEWIRGDAVKDLLKQYKKNIQYYEEETKRLRKIITKSNIDIQTSNMYGRESNTYKPAQYA